MGGEHHVSFHCVNRSPCSYIHPENKDNINLTEEDMLIWPKIKEYILLCLHKYGSHKHLYDEVYNWKSPKDIDLYWHAKDDDNILGLMFDISMLLAILYPTYICMCLDRFQYHDEFNKEWDMCMFPHANFTPGDIDFKIIDPPDDILNLREENKDPKNSENNIPVNLEFSKYNMALKYHEILKDIETLEKKIFN